MRTAAILPVKRFIAAKQRLGADVTDSLRAELAKAMVGDVLCALRDCAAIDTTIVVTCEPAVAAAARYVGAIIVEDNIESGQSAAASLGLARAVEQGFERALCVPGDCPALDPEELRHLLDEPAAATPRVHPNRCEIRGGGLPSATVSHKHSPEVVIVPDRHGTGTNGLLLAPPDAIKPSFGPESCARHGELAQAAGIACRVERLPSLLLDVDTGEDLAALRDRLAGQPAHAPRTRAVLGRSAPGRGGHGASRAA